MYTKYTYQFFNQVTQKVFGHFKSSFITLFLGTEVEVTFHFYSPSFFQCFQIDISSNKYPDFQK